MSNITDIDTKKTKIARLISEATPTVEQSKSLDILWALMAASLIGTMLPFCSHSWIPACAGMSRIKFDGLIFFTR